MLLLFLCTKSKQIVMRKFLYVFLVCFVGLYACVDDNLSLGKSLVDSSFLMCMQTPARWISVQSFWIR